MPSLDYATASLLACACACAFADRDYLAPTNLVVHVLCHNACQCAAAAARSNLACSSRLPLLLMHLLRVSCSTTAGHVCAICGSLAHCKCVYLSDKHLHYMPQSPFMLMPL